MNSTRPAKANWLLWTLWLVYALALFAATHLPIPDDYEDIVTAFDKLIHAAAFGVLSTLTILAFCWRGRLQTPAVWIPIFLLLYAALDEYLQSFVNRTPDVSDWMSDSAGILVAFLVLRWWARRSCPQRNSPLAIKADAA